MKNVIYAFMKSQAERVVFALIVSAIVCLFYCAHIFA